jgi:inorganic triphosphatase YgiF
MAVEIELKLTLPVRSAPRLRQFAPLSRLPSERRWMENLYLDTPGRTLWKEKMAVRRRIKTAAGMTWLLTVKTQGVTSDGVSRRDEWEFPMQPDRLDFSGVDDMALSGRLAGLSSELKPVFRVNFARQSWNLPGGEIGLDGSHVELALDFGHIRTESGEARREAFCEIELELLRGDEAALAIWGKRLRHMLPELRPQAVSKAERGYRLLACQYS